MTPCPALQRQVATRSASASSYSELPVPNPFWRAVSAMLYLVPGMDCFMMGFHSVYETIPDLLGGVSFWLGACVLAASAMHSGPMNIVRQTVRVWHNIDRLACISPPDARRC